MANLAAFKHRPKRLRDAVYFHPTETKALWDQVWSEARKQDWRQDNVGCVGDSDGCFYFQIPGLTTASHA